ncbi:MAG TPA: hypothetical protein VG868_00655, partial [Casimicrobiaceae bacterium]|nr:hypothetical protein [Casimicrobiaceae bacterium]
MTPTPDDQMFMVTAPLLGVAPRGPAGIQQPTCTPDEIDATAQLKRSVYGVVGVVQLHGQNCSIPWYSRPTSFIDANGQPLDIPV